jgi:protein MpaA
MLKTYPVRKLSILAILVFGAVAACVQLPEDNKPSASAQQDTGTGEVPMPDQPALTALPTEAAESIAGQADDQDAQRPEPAIDQETAALVNPGAANPDSGTGISAPVAGISVIDEYRQNVEKLCTQIGDKLGSVSSEDCLGQKFHFGGGFSINNRPLVVKEVAPEMHTDESIRVFLMGGIHGDEYSSISIIFKWLEMFSPSSLEGDFHWRVAPVVNPDGLLDEGQAKRQNANGVDLNRNFPSQDWSANAVTYWQESTGKNPRRFPGESAASEPEVQWIISQIEEFNPDVIVSVHAPYHLLDFDGPAQAPNKIGELYLHQLGVYPGSLGNYAGLNKRIPVVTLELPSAGILPPTDQIRMMWQDLVVWLDKEGRKTLLN